MELNSEEEVKEFLERIHIEYQFSCYKENSGEGCCLLGEYMQMIKNDFVKGCAALKRGCDKHQFGKACFLYGSNLFRGRGVEENQNESLRYQRKACEYGFKDGCLAAGYEHHMREHKGDLDEAMKHFVKACDMESGEACNAISSIYWDGEGHFPEDRTKSFEFAKRGCDYEHMESCSNLVMMYKYGIGTEKDMAKAKHYEEIVLDYKQQIERTTGFGLQEGT